MSFATSDAATVAFSTSNTAVEDIWICANPPQQAASYGGTDHMWLGNYAPGDYNRALIRFDVSSLANSYSSVQSITLQFWIQAAVGANTIGLYQPNAANANWVEGNSTGAPTGGSSWDYKINGASPVAWSGGEGMGSTGFGPLLTSTSFSQTSTGVFSLTITDAEIAKAVLDSFVAGTNPGFLVKAFNETGAPQNYLRVASSESTPGSRPSLIVNYSPIPEVHGPLATGALCLAGMLRRSRRS